MASGPESEMTQTGLDDARRALLRKRLRGKGAGRNGVPAIPALPGDAAARASYAQSRLWFLDHLFDATPAYHIYRAIEFRGALDEDALRLSLDGLLARHEALRTRFVSRDGELFQEVVDPCPMPFRRETLPPDEQSGEPLLQRLRDEVSRPFSLSRPPLVRATLFCRSDEDHVLLLTTHHIASDEWSDNLLMAELAERYNATLQDRPAKLSTVPTKYRDFAEWQRKNVEELESTQLEYWRSQLAGEPTSLDLPYDHARPPRPTLRGNLVRRTVSATVSAAVAQLIRTASVTPFVFLLTAFKVLLHRYTAQDDILVGIPAANRTAAEVQDLVGLFLNTLVLRSYPTGDRTFIDYLEEVKRTTLAAYDNQDMPLELVVADLQPDRDPSRNPLFQVMFVHSSDDSGTPDFTSLHSSPLAMDPGVAKFDLTLFTAWRDNSLELVAEYSSDLFDQATIDNMLKALETLLQGVTDNPRGGLDSFALVNGRTSPGVPADLIGPALTGVRDASWLDSFLRVAREKPGATALLHPDETVSYDALEQRSRAIAGLLRAQGVSAGQFVGIYMPRSVDQIASILGVLRAGCAYVPLDPGYPASRTSAIVEQLHESMPGTTVPVLVLDDVAHQFSDTTLAINIRTQGAGDSDESLPLPAPQDPAYVIFTSGSTGAPKGVVVTHSNLLHSNSARNEYYGSDADRFLLVSSFAFDSSIAGIFWTLGSGGALVLGLPDFERDPRQVAKVIEDFDVTHTLMLPALYDLVLDVAAPASLESLDSVIVAGEACSRHVVLRHKKRLPNTELFNEYGPTETCVWATVYKATGNERDTIPIGTPIAGMQAHLLDARLQPVPNGAVGELCLSGPGVTSGYLGQAELTAEKFVASTQAPDVTMYRTGDRARLAGGQLRYLGRVDEQIKLRGFRIEPAEIVAAIQERVDVADVAVQSIDANGRGDLLVAYLAASGDSEIDVARLRTELHELLPSYMVPSQLIVLPELPRTPNGKLDNARLPAPESAAPRVPPSTGRTSNDKILEQVLEIWSRTLGTDVGPEDNFFDIGGHSLLGVSVIMSMERELGVELPVASLFESPTPVAIAERVRDSRENSGFRYVIPVNPHGDRAPIFCIHGGARLLAEYLDEDQPVYLLYHDIRDANPEFESVEKVAAAYLAEIRRVQPEGPYNLYGFSYGGMLAYEIATRLQESGERIAFFALLDPPPLIDTSLLRVRIQQKIGELKHAKSRLRFFVRELPMVIWRRFRNLWRNIRWSYFQVTGRPRLMYGAAAILAVLGLAGITTAVQRLDVADWRPVAEPFPMKAGWDTEVEFSPGMSGFHEIELAVDRVMPESELADTVFAYKSPSALEIEWEVRSGAERIAGGTATDYLYLDHSPQNSIGKLAYVLLGVPLARGPDHINSNGLRGHFTWSRGLGAFRLNAGETYVLSASVERSFPELESANPHLNVRFNRRDFYAVRPQVALQGLTGYLLLAVSVLVAGAAWFRRRQTVPPKLIAHRDLKHNERLSLRYQYKPYDGDASLFLPDRHPDVVKSTVESWGRVINGKLNVDVIEGAREHLQLIHSDSGAELARRFAVQLRSAQKGDPDVINER